MITRCRGSSTALSSSPGWEAEGREADIPAFQPLFTETGRPLPSPHLQRLLRNRKRRFRPTTACAKTPRRRRLRSLQLHKQSHLPLPSPVLCLPTSCPLQHNSQTSIAIWLFKLQHKLVFLVQVTAPLTRDNEFAHRTAGAGGAAPISTPITLLLAA